MAQPTTAKFGKMRVLLGEGQFTSIAVTSLSNTNPTRVTVAVGDITKFKNGDLVEIAGAVGTGMTVANGLWTINTVGAPANTFGLVGCNTSTGAAPQTTGVTAKNHDQVGAPIIYAAPCGLTTKALQFSKNLTEVDIPDCDDEDAVAWIGRDAQNLSATVSGDGVAAAESVPDWQLAYEIVDAVPMKIEVQFSTGILTSTGLFQVDNLSYGAEQAGRVTLGFNAQSDGKVTTVWTPTP